VDDPPRERALTADGVDGGALIPPGLDATLVLVRHGESTFIVEGRFQGQAETELSPDGVAQARLTAARLAWPAAPPALPVPPSRPLEVVHSPLARTAATAGAITGAMADPGSFGDVPARPDPGFLEIGQGAWAGLPREEIEARWGETLATWRRRPLEAWAPGGEALPDVQARVRPALARALANLAGAAGLSAGTPGRRSLDQVAGYRTGPSDGPWSVVVGHDGVFKVLLLTLFDLPLDRFWMWSFDLAGICVLEIRGGRPLVRAMNLVEHLAPVLDEESRAETDERRRSGAL
jgi:phosphoserine phosphatase